MALKLNDCHNVKHLQHHDQSKCTKVDARQKLCLPVFWMMKVLRTLHMLHKAKLGTIIFIWQEFDVF